jgi:hypothetical protein
MNITIQEEMENVLTEIPSKQLKTDTYKVYVNARTEVLTAFYCDKRLTRLVTWQFYRLYELDSYKILSDRTY